MVLSFIKIKQFFIPIEKENTIQHLTHDTMKKAANSSVLQLKNMVVLSFTIHCAVLALLFFIQGQPNRLPLDPSAHSTLVSVVSLNDLPAGGDCNAIASAPETKKDETAITPPVPQKPKKKPTAGKKPHLAITSEKPPVPPKDNVVSTVSDSVTTVQPVSLVTSAMSDPGNNADPQPSGNSAVGSGATLALNTGSGGQGVGFGPGGHGQGSGSGTVRDAYYLMIQSKIDQHKIYPQRARLRQIQGRVVIHFIITLEGVLKGIDVVQSSGFTVLDQAGVKAVRDASPFPKPPIEIFNAAVSIEVPIVFELI